MYWRANPYHNLSGMARLLDEMNRTFDSGADERYSHPKVNVWSNDDGMILSVELPGVDPKEVEITVQDNKLSVSGSYPARPADDKASYHRSERRSGRFTREVTLPYRPATDKVQAEGRHGVVYIHLPKPEEEKPRRIDVHVS